jgi:HAE1 family hydrophobic/amphiphilic exporter-1
LVDYINKLRARNVEKQEAIMTAGVIRLRPILMTTATTVLGLLPLALGIGEGAELRAPMAIAVISGLITSTALTLIAIPTMYSLLDGIVAWLAGARTKKRDKTPIPLGADIDSVTP